jgi:hypothetical protein
LGSLHVYKFGLRKFSGKPSLNKSGTEHSPGWGRGGEVEIPRKNITKYRKIDYARKNQSKKSILETSWTEIMIEIFLRVRIYVQYFVDDRSIYTGIVKKNI